MNDFTKEELYGEFKNSHDDKACSILKEYDSQADYLDGTPKPVKEIKTLKWYADKHGYSTKELKQHWKCIGF